MSAQLVNAIVNNSVPRSFLLYNLYRVSTTRTPVRTNNACSDAAQQRLHRGSTGERSSSARMPGPRQRELCMSRAKPGESGQVNFMAQHRACRFEIARVNDSQRSACRLTWHPHTGCVSGIMSWQPHGLHHSSKKQRDPPHSSRRWLHTPQVTGDGAAKEAVCPRIAAWHLQRTSRWLQCMRLTRSQRVITMQGIERGRAGQPWLISPLPLQL